MIYTAHPWQAQARAGEHEPVIVKAHDLGVVAVLPRNEYAESHAQLIVAAVPLARDVEHTVERLSALDVLLSQGGISQADAAGELAALSEHLAKTLRLAGWTL